MRGPNASGFALQWNIGLKEEVLCLYVNGVSLVTCNTLTWLSVTRIQTEHVDVYPPEVQMVMICRGLLVSVYYIPPYKSLRVKHSSTDT